MELNVTPNASQIQTDTALQQLWLKPVYTVTHKIKKYHIHSNTNKYYSLPQYQQIPGGLTFIFRKKHWE